MTTIRHTDRWDAITTPQGHLIVIMPPCPLPRAIVLARDGIYVGTAGAAFLLIASRDLLQVAREARLAIVAEADDMIRRETAVPIIETVDAHAQRGETR